jgi:hypothetical protein
MLLNRNGITSYNTFRTQRDAGTKSRDGCTHFSPGLYGRTSASKDISSYDAFVEKEQVLHLTEQLLELQGEGRSQIYARDTELNYSGK